MRPFYLFPLFLGFVMGISACGGEDEGLSGEALCAANCDRAVAAGCPNTSPDFATGCPQVCQGTRSKHPSCVEQFDGISACVGERVEFSCDASGNLDLNPDGACAAEVFACAECTGDLMQCVGF